LKRSAVAGEIPRVHPALPHKCMAGQKVAITLRVMSAKPEICTFGLITRSVMATIWPFMRQSRASPWYLRSQEREKKGVVTRRRREHETPRGASPWYLRLKRFLTHRSPLTVHRIPFTAYQKVSRQVIFCNLPLTDYRLPITDHRSPITSGRHRPTSLCSCVKLYYSSGMMPA
jgi:hypothetical protein